MSINSSRGVERCLCRINLFQEEARDWAAADPVETGWLTRKIEISRLTSEKDGIVPSQSHLPAKGDRVLSPSHGQSIIEDIGRCQPGLNVGIARSRTVLLEEGILR